MEESRGGYQLYDDIRSMTSSPYGKSVPKMKPSLLSTDNMRFKSSHGNDVTHSPRLRDDYGARAKTLYSSHRDSSDDDHSFGLQSLPANFHTSSMQDRYTREHESKLEICPICLDEVNRPKELECKHRFCSDCIKSHFAKSRPSCPVCGAIFGKVRGDQPKTGAMTYETNYGKNLAGYSRASGVIIITYTFPDGIQEVLLFATVSVSLFRSPISGPN